MNKNNSKVFALDIGTRSVVGIVLEKAADTFNVIDILTKEHSERAMLDGQIHDVIAVSKVISAIKSELEEIHGPLHKVCVAAAGRSLKTERAEAKIDISGQPLLQKQDILHLELSAVQTAQAIVAKANAAEKSHYYYCVGYSVLYYRLDGEVIGSLIDQQGQEASVEIIATFLPKVVVESLISALHRSNLEMEALTLEPIAAINVLIPPSMRRLNVALVDIGAGTSDIAITDMGTVIAYGMVPVAGDEITEAISDQYLLDFPLAEAAKRKLHQQETISITDILGFETEISKTEVIREISPAIDRLAQSICHEILKLNNNNAPKAVMLVGGGSMTPELPERVAALLDLPSNRVAIRGLDAISSLSIANHIQKGPELVTPIGIAVAAHMSPVQYVSVYVNEQPIRLFEINKLTIGDCLLAAGIKMSKLFGRPGLAKMVEVNGQVITIPGKQGNPPSLLLNCTPALLDQAVKNGDIIFAEKGPDGEQTPLQISDLIDHLPVKKISVNGKRYTVDRQIICNGNFAKETQLVQDRDVITWSCPSTVAELLKALNLESLLEELQPIRMMINSKEHVFPETSGMLLINQKPAHTDELVNNLDDIRFTKKQRIAVNDVARIKQIELVSNLPVTFNGNSLILSKKKTEFHRQGKALQPTDLLLDGDCIEIINLKPEPFIFQDLFNHVEIEMPAKTNGHFVLLRNNKEATFFEELMPGDDLKIEWPIAELK